MYKKFLRTTLFLCVTALGSRYSHAIDWDDAIEKSGSKPKWEALSKSAKRQCLAAIIDVEVLVDPAHIWRHRPTEEAFRDMEAKEVPATRWKNETTLMYFYVQGLARGQEFPEFQTKLPKFYWGLKTIKNLVNHARLNYE